MSRLHKNVHFSLVHKFYFLFFLFVLYGVYKNGILPVLQGFYPPSQIFLLSMYPACGFLIGFLFDFFFKNDCVFTNKFYGLLFSLILPISTRLWVFIVLLTFMLGFHTFVIYKKDWDFNFLVFGKLFLVFFLSFFQSYSYANLLEESNLFVYSFLDGILGHNVSGLFTSNVLFTFLAFLLLFFDSYYKKEIPLKSYSVYLITLVFYSFMQGNMSFLLQNMFSSTVLFALVFIATLSMFSPYSKKRLNLYSILLGLLILPCSLYFNFFEGVYLSLFLVNLFIILLNGLQNLFFSFSKK